MAWCKLEDTFHDDPKFRRLSSEMGFDKKLGPEKGAALARGMVASLWSWAARHAPDGRLDGATPADIERICGHVSGNGALYQRLVSGGFVDETTLGAATERRIHRYWERAESHKAAIRKANSREKKIDVTGQSQPESKSGTRLSRLEDREDREERDLAQAPVQLTLVNGEPKPKKSPKQKPEDVTETHRVRLAFESAFETKYGTKYLSWDGASGKYAKELVAGGNLDRTLALIPKYFEMTLKEPHTFFEGFDSFRSHINKLNAKLAPQRDMLSPDEQERIRWEKIRMDEAGL